MVFRHIVEKVDGKINGPESYTGKIGGIISAKKDEWKINARLKNFEPREGFVEETDFEFKNNDEKLLYLLCQFVQHVHLK